MNVKKLTRQAIVAAIYVVLTLALAPISYGPLQFRISEVLVLLAFFNPEYIAGLTIGVLISNMASSLGPIDMVVGTLHTFVSVCIMSRLKNFYLSSLVPVVLMFFIAGEIYFLMPNPVGFFLIYGELMLSEFITLCIIGVPIYYFLSKNKTIVEKLDFRKKI